VRVRQGTQKNAVDDTKNRGVRPYAQCDGDDSYSRKRWTSHQFPGSVSNVTPKSLQKPASEKIPQPELESEIVPLLPELGVPASDKKDGSSPKDQFGHETVLYLGVSWKLPSRRLTMEVSRCGNTLQSL
jgi:hypothetical protein